MLKMIKANKEKIYDWADIIHKGFYSLCGVIILVELIRPYR